MGEPAQAIPRRATYEDLLAVPDHLVAEIIDGTLITSPRPAASHALAALTLGMDLGPFHRKPGGTHPGGWWILFEPELHLEEDIIVPDLAGWRRERMPVVPPAAYFELPPDWVCEVISPSSARLDRFNKMTIYAREGVSHIWLIDPRARLLEVYRLEEGRWVRFAVHAGDSTVRAEPFESVELELERWWLPSEGEQDDPR